MIDTKYNFILMIKDTKSINLVGFDTMSQVRDKISCCDDFIVFDGAGNEIYTELSILNKNSYYMEENMSLRNEIKFLRREVNSLKPNKVTKPSTKRKIWM